MGKILLHIGYPKAGSSFLGNWFHKHPDIIFQDFSIGGFYNTQQLMDASVSQKDYSDKIFVIRDTKFTTPHSEEYKKFNNIETIQQRIALTLYSLFPNAKVLIITRGFESAIKANYSQYVKEGGIIKFSELIQKHKNSRWLPFNYSFIIESYKNLFGKDNVLVLPFELLKTNQDTFLYKIEKFLEITHLKFPQNVSNPSLSPQGMEFIRRVNTTIYYLFYIFGPLQPFVYKIHIKILDAIKTKSWNNFIFITLSKSVKKKPLEIESIREIRDRFYGYSNSLKDLPDFQLYKKEYFID